MCVLFWLIILSVQMDAVFRKFPQDIQSIIASFIPVWQRFGLKKEPVVFQSSSHDRYYRTIRRAPKGSFLSPFSECFYYRFQRHFFRFIISVESDTYKDDSWTIIMEPQYRDIDLQDLHALKQKLPLWKSPFPSQTHLTELWHADAERQIGVQFRVVRKDSCDALTRQTSAEQFLVYIRKLSPFIHNTYQNIVRSRLKKK